MHRNRDQLDAIAVAKAEIASRTTEVSRMMSSTLDLARATPDTGLAPAPRPPHTAPAPIPPRMRASAFAAAAAGDLRTPGGGSEGGRARGGTAAPRQGPLAPLAPRSPSPVATLQPAASLRVPGTSTPRPAAAPDPLAATLAAIMERLSGIERQLAATTAAPTDTAAEPATRTGGDPATDTRARGSHTGPEDAAPPDAGHDDRDHDRDRDRDGDRDHDHDRGHAGDDGDDDGDDYPLEHLSVSSYFDSPAFSRPVALTNRGEVPEVPEDKAAWEKWEADVCRYADVYGGQVAPLLLPRRHARNAQCPRDRAAVQRALEIITLAVKGRPAQRVLDRLDGAEISPAALVEEIKQDVIKHTVATATRLQRRLNNASCPTGDNREKGITAFATELEEIMRLYRKAGLPASTEDFARRVRKEIKRVYPELWIITDTSITDVWDAFAAYTARAAEVDELEEAEGPLAAAATAPGAHALACTVPGCKNPDKHEAARHYYYCAKCSRKHVKGEPCATAEGFRARKPRDAKKPPSTDTTALTAANKQLEAENSAIKAEQTAMAARIDKLVAAQTVAMTAMASRARPAPAAIAGWDCDGLE